ncbi:MAG: MFS transporter [Smithellaceae bacterium]|nr:MFS transporter [Smithellaceae bacterium]
MKEDSFPGTFTKQQAYFIFTLLFLLYMFDYIDRMVIVSLFPYIKQDWGLSDAQCGLMVSVVYWSILLFTLPASFAIDRWSRKKSIGIMSVFWSLATLACAAASNFWQLITLRAFVGIGEAGYAPGGTAMISAIFPVERRARMLGIWNASIPLGSAMGIALGGLIAEHFGWRYAFGIVALPGMLVAFLFFRVKDYKTVDLQKGNFTSSPRHTDGAQWKAVLLHIVRIKSLLFNNLAFAGNVFVTVALMSWLPSYFNRMEGLAMSQAGVKTSVVMLMAIVGAPLGGFLADRWFRVRPNARLLFAAISSLLTAGVFFLAFTAFTGNVQFAVMVVGGILAVAFVPASVAVTQDVVHPGIRATSLSICIIIQHILGSSLGPPVIGYLSDTYGIAFAMKTLPVFNLIAASFFLMASFYYNADAAKVIAIQTQVDD